jgi:hypothetical protein
MIGPFPATGYIKDECRTPQRACDRRVAELIALGRFLEALAAVVLLLLLWWWL